MEKQDKRDRESNLILEKVYIVVQILLLFMALLNVSLELCATYQVPKNVCFYRGISWFLLFCIVNRRISLKKIEIWATLAVGSALVIFNLKHNNFSVETCGPDFFRNIVYYRVAMVLFAVLLSDVIRNKAILSLLKKRWLYVVFAVVIGILYRIPDDTMVFPLIIPTVALLTSDWDKEKFIKYTDCFAISLYLVFCFLITRSLIMEPNNLESGRYMGNFISVENIGMFTGSAIICCFYFFVRTINQKKKVWLCIPVVLTALYPIAMLIYIGSRMTICSVAFSLPICAAFMLGNKSKNSLLFRVLVMALFFVIVSIGLVLASKYINNKFLYNGRFVYEGAHSYAISHLSALTNPKFSEGVFSIGILNNINRMSSSRLEIWYDSLKQIGIIGKTYDPSMVMDGVPDPHNIFIELLIEKGAILGGLLVAWIIFNLGVNVYRCLKRDESGYLSFLWMLFSLVLMSASIIGWRSLLPLGTFVLQLPISLPFRSNNHIKEQMED